MPLYKPENIPYLNKAQGFYEQYMEGWAKPDWKTIIEDKKAGLMIWQRNEGGLKAMKAEAIIDRSVDEIFTVIGDIVTRKDYDATYDDGWALEKVAH